MKGIAQHILIAVIGLFFILSACEISTSYFHNTFDDDYDYYIQPDNSPSTAIYAPVITDLTFIIIPVIQGFTLTESTTFRGFNSSENSYYTPPLYLKNLVLLI